MLQTQPNDGNVRGYFTAAGYVDDLTNHDAMFDAIAECISKLRHEDGSKKGKRIVPKRTYHVRALQCLDLYAKPSLDPSRRE